MTDRPRYLASVISDKVTELIRELLKDAPKEYHGMIVDEALNSICVTWSLKKSGGKVSEAQNRDS